MDPDRKLFDTAFDRLDVDVNGGWPDMPTRPKHLEALSLPQWTALLWPKACTVRRIAALQTDAAQECGKAKQLHEYAPYQTMLALSAAFCPNCVSNECVVHASPLSRS